MTAMFFYQPSTVTVIDSVNPETGLGRFGKRTLAQTREKYGDEVIELPAADFPQLHYEHWRSEPHETTRDWWEYAIGVLPPEGYVSDERGTSFKMCEYTSIDITSIYAKLRGKFYAFRDRYSLPHAGIMARVEAVEQANRAAIAEAIPDAHQRPILFDSNLEQSRYALRHAPEVIAELALKGQQIDGDWPALSDVLSSPELVSAAWLMRTAPSEYSLLPLRDGEPDGEPTGVGTITFAEAYALNRALPSIDGGEQWVMTTNLSDDYSDDY